MRFQLRPSADSGVHLPVLIVRFAISYYVPENFSPRMFPDAPGAILKILFILSPGLAGDICCDRAKSGLLLPIGTTHATALWVTGPDFLFV
jgi:hypothetical protein